MSTVRLPAPPRHHDLAALHDLIRRRAAKAHRHLPPGAREEAVAEVTASVAVAVSRLAGRRAVHVGLVPALVRYAALGRAAGRRVGTPTNRRDALSPVPRSHHRVVSLEAVRSGGRESWRDGLADARRADPADVACFRLDFAAWLGRLTPRLRRVAEGLAVGERPGELASSLGVSPGRLSQLRDRLRADWSSFVDGPAPAAS